MGTLFVVSTPIGNLADLTLRAQQVLGAVRLIAAEDTRHTRKLLTHYGISTPTVSYHQHNERARLEPILAALAVGDVALVSDAGTPGVSDPGLELIRAALAAGHTVTAAPGPVAAVMALVLSGFDPARYCYLGFLPRQGNERRALLAQVADQPWPLVVYEAPHRLAALLADLRTVLGNRPCAVARELTKVHEEVVRGSLDTAIAHFAASAPRGEFTVVIDGAPPPDPSAVAGETADRTAASVAQVSALVAGGMSPRDAVQQVAAASGLPRRQVYNLWLAAAATADQ
ncbi:MAG: 16S rRNA (cytidine(1402)-2'-O)-methyltransferase [Chloroflexota bacterium]|nr:16S rRNA (cytidine(1402)-2'-O)-methyltransferase [Chloroflexota bacterium]